MSNGPLAFYLPLVCLRLQSLTIWASSSLSNNYSSCIYKLLDAINLLLLKAGIETNAIFTSSSFVHLSVEYRHWYGTIGWYLYMSAKYQSPRNRYIGRLLVNILINMSINTWPSVSQHVDQYVGLYMASMPADTWLAYQSTHFLMLHCPWIPLKYDAIAVPIFSKKQKIISN